MEEQLTHNSTNPMPHRKEKSDSKILEYVLALIAPPIAVVLNRGVGLEAVLSIPLTLAFWFPGMLYALYLIGTRENANPVDL